MTKKNKIILSFLITLILVFSIGKVNTYAASENPSGENSIKVLLDGKYLDFQEPPVELDGRTLVPMRDIFEALGVTLYWDDTTSTVTGVKGTDKVILQLDNPTAYVNDNPITLSVPGTLINNKTMVPTRFIAESMNCVVSWDEGTKTVIVIPDKIISFGDKNLETAVKNELGNSSVTLKVSDVENLQNLNVSEEDINSLEGLQYLLNLKYLTVSDNNISDLSPLSMLIKLQYVNFANNKVTDISPLKNLVNLTGIASDNNKIGDISSLSKLTSLENLYISNNKIKDISVVEGFANLKSLYANYTLIEDIKPINSLKNLSILYIGESQITDISPLKGCTKLTELNIYGDAVLDVSPLKALDSLKTLYYDRFAKETQINSGLFSRSSEVTSKADKIISEIVKPGMSDLDKELAIHDYIILNTEYDSSVEENGTASEYSHSLYGVLVQGVGVCDGYSGAMKALLNKVGIKSYIVTGDSIDLTEDNLGHAWNLVNLGGKYYYVDATWDDSDMVDDVNTLSHYYFNLSTKQISVNHKFDRDFFPEASTDSVDFNRWNGDNHYFVTNDDFTYSCLNDYILKIDNKTQKAVKLGVNKAAEIAYNDGWIYYINNSDGNKLYKIKTDGSEDTLVHNEPVAHLNIISGVAYFVDSANLGIVNGSASSNYIHKLNLSDNIEKRLSYDDITTTLYIYNNKLYFKSYTYNQGSKFKKSEMDGTNPSYLVNAPVRGFRQNGTSIGFSLYQAETIKDNWIYYISDNMKNRLYKVDLEGKNETSLNTGSIYGSSYHIVGDWIYYSNADDNNKVYKVKTDGTHNSLVDIK